MLRGEIHMELESMAHEEKFIELLGLKLVGPTPNFSFHILNEEDETVGFIQRKKVKQEKDKLPAVYGYHMVIESNQVSYNGTRSFQDEDQKFCYLFHVKDEQNQKQKVWLNLEKNYPNMTIQGGSMGETIFKLTPDFMYLNFRRDTCLFHKEEVVELYHSVFENSYRYQMRFCRKEKSLAKEKETTVFDIQYKDSLHRYLGGGNVMKEMMVWENNEKVSSDIDFFDSTLEEEIMHHKRGIESFRYVRRAINERLPFKQDIVSVMAEQYQGTFHSEYGIDAAITLFLPELKAASEKKLVK